VDRLNDNICSFMILISLDPNFQMHRRTWARGGQEKRH
jgi:hypothetical protein